VERALGIAATGGRQPTLEERVERVERELAQLDV
jgi:hypothetical protein